MLMKKLLLFTLVVLAACATPTDTPDATEIIVYTVGFISPLTGDGAGYGLPIQAATQLAVADLNEQWAAEGKRLDVIYEDGRCNGKDALVAAQKLVNVDGVDIILGPGCSGETLGVAPFAEENQILLLSPASSSPDVTNAGDFVFRNYPSDVAQVDVMTAFIEAKGWTRVSIISENTDYAQALRTRYAEVLLENGVEILADEVTDPESRDVRTQMTKVLANDPEAVIFLPQTIPMSGVYAKQALEMGMSAVGLGNDVLILDQTISDHGTELEGFYAPRPIFDDQSEGFVRLVDETGCDIGLYCAASYDTVFIIADALEACGDDSVCVRDALYATQNWEGLAGVTSFDENGDPAGNFEVLQIVDSSTVLAE